MKKRIKTMQFNENDSFQDKKLFVLINKYASLQAGLLPKAAIRHLLLSTIPGSIQKLRKGASKH